MGKQIGKGLDPLGVFNDDIGLENAQRPTDPSYFNADGTLKDQYRLSNGSDYTQIATDKLNTDTAAARDSAAVGSAGARASAMNSLASRGGIDKTSKLLLGRQGMTDLTNANQDVTNQNIQGGQGIAQNQFNISRDAEKTNLQNTLGLTQDIYNQKMAAWGASKTADAQANVQNKKGILGK